MVGWRGLSAALPFKGDIPADRSTKGICPEKQNTAEDAVLSESVLDQSGPNDHFGENDLIENGPFWSI